MADDFFKDFNKEFNRGMGSFGKLDKSSFEGYTVVVRYRNGNQTEHEKITNPWQYMKKARQNPEVETTWIKG